jgi:hypothetical protein
MAKAATYDTGCLFELYWHFLHNLDVKAFGRGENFVDGPRPAR